MIILNKEAWEFTMFHRGVEYTAEAVINPTEKAVYSPEYDTMLYQFRITVKKFLAGKVINVSRGICWLTLKDLGNMKLNRDLWFNDNIMTNDIVQHFGD